MGKHTGKSTGKSTEEAANPVSTEAVPIFFSVGTRPRIEGFDNCCPVLEML